MPLFNPIFIHFSHLMSSPFPSSSYPPFIAAICPLVHRLYVQSPILRLLFLAQSIGSGLSLVVLAIGMLQICTRQPIQLPIGTLLMMLNLCVSLLLANVGALLSALYHLHVPIFRPPSSHCYWLSFTQADCLMIRTILNVSLFATYMSGACLALERMAGSLLLIRRLQTKRAIAVFLAILQWLLSIFAAIPPSFSSIPSVAISPHCAQFTPSPTQIRPLFFAILGMQAFVLAIYSILTYHNHFDKQISRELARQNPIILEQIHATEQSLPSAAIVVGLFLASTFLDRNFLMALANAFFGSHSMVGGNKSGKNGNGGDEMFKIAFWSEFQILAIPLMSLLLVAILQVQIRSQRIAEEDIYERVGGSANSAANVLAVRKVGSALGGGDRIIGREEDDRLSDPYEKTSASTASPSTSISLSDGGGSEGCAMDGKGKKHKGTRENQDLGRQRH